jgi:hypothetical protein
MSRGCLHPCLNEAVPRPTDVLAEQDGPMLRVAA